MALALFYRKSPRSCALCPLLIRSLHNVLDAESTVPPDQALVHRPGIQKVFELLLYRATLYPFLKCRFSLSRIFNRARIKRDLTVGTERPSICAVSSVEICSMSRKAKTKRQGGSSFSIASANSFCNSDVA